MISSKHLLCLLVSAIASISLAQQGRMDHHAMGVDSRGDHAMGFRHDLTHHHFHLFSDGGSIDVVPNQASNSAQRDAVRGHLKMIAGIFAGGDFHLPMFIHDTVVPGQRTMQRLKKQIGYSYADLPTGGRVRISSRNYRAVAAIHRFLRFQIRDHRTGDSGKVERA